MVEFIYYKMWPLRTKIIYEFMKLYVWTPQGNNIRPSFGNNLFIYFGLQIIVKEHGHLIVDNYNELTNPITIDDSILYKYATNMSDNSRVIIDLIKERDVYMQCYFQDSRMILYYRDYLKSIINSENHYIITPPTEKFTVKISDIANTSITDIPGTNTIVVHFRLSDFKHAGGKSSEIIHPSVYFGILDAISYDKMILVCDKITEPFEEIYINLFKRRYNNVEVRCGNKFLEDFVYITKASRIIVSNSTFCWLAAFLSNADETHIIKNEYHSTQYMGKINSNSKVYPIRYISPEELLRYE